MSECTVCSDYSCEQCVIEQRDIARAEWQGADAKAEALQGELDEANAKVAKMRVALAAAADAISWAYPGSQLARAKKLVEEALAE